MTSSDKNIITQSIYKKVNVNENISEPVYLYVYSAGWCGSCNRIKTHFEVLLKDYDLISEDPISKDYFKKNKNNLIPFFELGNKKIQTSDPEVLKEFLGN